ncbi:MAG: 2Fe-2S iron-sulfur cluster binding domain-containing protein [Pseudomonadota bacterium]
MSKFKSTVHRRVSLTDGTEFDVAPGDTLLQGGLKAGLDWPNGCRVGLCGSCRCRVTRGKVRALTSFSTVLAAQEQQDGHVLACRAEPESDLTVESDQLFLGLGPDDADIEGVVSRVDQLTPLVCLVQIDLDHPHARGYSGGQYARLEVPGAVAPRCFSFANACRGDGQLRFFVRLFPGGQLGDWLASADRLGARVRVSRPLGHFVLRDAHRPALFFAGGTGLAPVLAMLEELASRPAAEQPPVRVAYAARDQQHLFHRRYLDPIVDRWAAGTRIDFINVLSREPRPSSWRGLRGHFFEHLPLLTAGFEQADAYLCGPPGLVDATQLFLVKAGFTLDRISGDRFLPSFG